jgi:large subunit ribosomal protein L10e
MARRKWTCFKTYTKRGYQKKRSRSHRREYVRGGADPKITRFDVGNRKRIDWPITLGLMAKHNVRISHHALEAARVKANQYLVKRIGVKNYHMKVRKHPHNVYREHSMMAFAGADRLSSGMRNGFGHPIGRCARTHAGDIILQIGCEMRHVNQVKEAIKRAKFKICVGTRIVLLDSKDPDVINKLPVVSIEKFVRN